MKFTGDYHLHTRASDGRTSLLRAVRFAKKSGLSEIAISDHSFATLFFHMTDKKLAAQSDRIAELKDKDKCDIKILQGIEANLIGDKLDLPHSVIRKLDVLTVGFHRFIGPSKMMGESEFLMVNGFGSTKRKEKLAYVNTEAFISVMENYPIDVIAHLGHRTPVDFVKVCECAARHNVYVELNEKHIDVLENGIDAALNSGVKFIVGSDAHSVKKIGGFSKVEKFIDKHKIHLDRVYGIDGNSPTFKDKKEWQYGRDA